MDEADEVTYIEENARIRWFGPPWMAPITCASTEVPIPAGARCAYCNRFIAEGDRGVMILHEKDVNLLPIRRPWHRACFERNAGAPADIT